MSSVIANATSEVCGEIVAREQLNDTLVTAMYGLFCKYFAAHHRETFEADLAKKDTVILLWSGSQLAGFSTVRMVRMRVAGEEIAVLVSGDTIVDRAYWASGVLERCWLRVALEAKDNYACPLYWLLICSGYRTYRYLPAFFQEFWPRHDAPTPPAAQGLLDAVARAEFGARYDDGIVRLAGGQLREGVSPVAERQLRNPHVAFFVKANPGHVHGDELACITLVDEGNLTRAGHKVLRQLKV